MNLNRIKGDESQLRGESGHNTNTICEGFVMHAFDYVI